MSFDSSCKNDLWKVLSNSVLHLDEKHRDDYIFLNSHPTAQQSQDFSL